MKHFFIIGAMKAGTTSLHSYLDAHPDIEMSDPKETDYFVAEKNLARGSKWYDNCFSANPTWRGESSVNYSKAHAFSGVPERIISKFPHAKFIYILRDPVERMISHYNHQFVEGDETRAIEEALLEPDNHYFKTSQYYWQLHSYLEHVALDQVHLTTAEELRHKTQSTLTSIYQFLGLQAHPTPISGEMHASSAKLMRPRFARMIGKSRVKKFLRPLMPDRLLDTYIKHTQFAPPEQRLSEDATTLLEKSLTHDVSALRELSGEKFAFWKRSYQA